MSSKPILKSKSGKKKKSPDLKSDLKKQDPRIKVMDQVKFQPVLVRDSSSGEWVKEAGAKFKAVQATLQPYEKTSAGSTAYDAMNKFYREYRRDRLVRRCLNILGAFSCNRGFETVLEPPEPMEDEEADAYVEKYDDLKEYINSINRIVQLDKVCLIAVIKSKIFGHCGFEIVPWAGTKRVKDPERLIPLKSEKLEANITNWNLNGYNYDNIEMYYSDPSDLLYFVNNDLEGDLEGLSDIEPVMDELETRRTILAQSLKEGSLVAWAGIGWVQIDTTGRSDADAEQDLINTQNAIAPGKWIVTNQKIPKIEVHEIDPKLDKMILTIECLEEAIIGNFGIPKFMVGKEKQFNRATAYAELEAFISGPVEDVRRWLRREIEKQWYEPLTRKFLKLGEKEKLPILVKHKWNPITTEDFAEKITALSQAYGDGMGWLTQHKAWELAGLDPSEIENPLV